MSVTIWTDYPEVAGLLMVRYIDLFSEKPLSHGANGSLIWYHFETANLAHFWKEWVKSALLTGLIYEGKVKT